MRFIPSSIVRCSKCSYNTAGDYLVVLSVSGSHSIKLPIPLNTELFADSPRFLMLRCLCPSISPRVEFFPHLPCIFAHLNHTHFYKPISNVSLFRFFLIFPLSRTNATPQGPHRALFAHILPMLKVLVDECVCTCVCVSKGRVEGGKLSPLIIISLKVNLMSYIYT